ncbi:MAG: hypothetical protein ACSLE2_17375, partial [Lysobacterales bacterium]
AAVEDEDVRHSTSFYKSFICKDTANKSISYANLYLIVLFGNLSVVFNPLLLKPQACPISAEYSAGR